MATPIASYYAQVGVGIDKNSLTQVQRFLDSIQQKMESFGKTAGNKGISLRINNFSINQGNLRRAISTAVAGAPIRIDSVSVANIRVNRTSARAALNQALNFASSGQAGGVRLDNFAINRKALETAINGAMNVSGKGARFRLGARLSQESLSDMKNQVRQAINQLVVSPTINPRVNAARVRGGGSSSGRGSSGDRLTTRNPRSQNPWHNPMMVGGAAGAMMRYGAFSLPFVAGAYGLNTLVNRTTELEGQSIMMRAAIQDRGLAAQQEQYINQLGDRLGIRTSSLTPFYAQMYAGARGTSLEQSLPQGFSDFMDYASVMGLNEEQLKGSIRAISQMVSKGRIQS